MLRRSRSRAQPTTTLRCWSWSATPASYFDHFGEDTQAYGYATSFALSASCENEVVNQLLEPQRHAAEYARRHGRVAPGEFFYAEQNALLVKNAEQYYRSMFLRGQVSSQAYKQSEGITNTERTGMPLSPAGGRRLPVMLMALVAESSKGASL